jgi:hypothetical protein
MDMAITAPAAAPLSRRKRFWLWAAAIIAIAL